MKLPQAPLGEIFAQFQHEGHVVFLKGDMPIGYQSAARDPIFGMAASAS